MVSGLIRAESTNDRRQIFRRAGGDFPALLFCAVIKNAGFVENRRLHIADELGILFRIKLLSDEKL